MRTKVIILSALLLFSVELISQQFECGVFFDPKDTIQLPEFGQNEILELILNITMKKERSSTIGIPTDNIPFYIPVKIWVYSDNNGQNQALSEADVNILFNEVNSLFAARNTGIQFYMKCGISFLNSSRFNNLTSDSEFNVMVASNREQYACNWHFVNTSPSWSGISRFPWESNNFSLALVCGKPVNNDILTPEQRPVIILHEIGHTLGLRHTHDNIRGGGLNGDAGKCFQETVSRKKTQGIGCVSTIGQKKCEINGDGLCDTDAAPNSNFFRYIEVDVSCKYFDRWGLTDNWGDSWTPPTKNYMSYLSNIDCMQEFTQMQIGVMHANIFLRMATIIPPFTLKPWYNLHSITLRGSVNSGEKESYIVPKKIELATGNNTYTINHGGSVSLHAGEEIIFNQGFTAHQGSMFTAKAEALTGCSTILPGSGGKNSSYDIPEGGLSQEDIDACLEIIEKALRREYYNYSKDEFSDDDSLIDNDFDFIIYPNPNDGHFIIVLERNEMHPFAVEIYDSVGFLVSKSDYCNTNQANVEHSDLKSGVYFVKVIIGNSFVTKQVVIQL